MFYFPCALVIIFQGHGWAGRTVAQHRQGPQSSELTRVMANGCFCLGLPNEARLIASLMTSRSVQIPSNEEWSGLWSNKSEVWTAEWLERLNHDFSKKNVSHYQ